MSGQTAKLIVELFLGIYLVGLPRPIIISLYGLRLSLVI